LVVEEQALAWDFFFLLFMMKLKLRKEYQDPLLFTKEKIN